MELADISKLNQYAFYLDDLCKKKHLMMDKFINANCLQNKSIVPIYEVITKADYENRLKTEKVAMLDKIRAEIEALSPEPTAYDVVDGNPIKDAVWEIIADVLKIIDKYKAESEG